MNKRTIGIVIGVILAVAGFFVLTKPAEQTKGTPTNHVASEGSTGVVLVEYGDFQCPACGAYHPILQQVKELYKDRVTFQFRHFPLEALHKNARAASRAAEAASNQGKFWEMHDLLFETQQSWGETGDPLSIFEGYARQIGVADMTKFTEDYKSSAVNASINADMDEGRKLGAQSTPTFVLDGVRLEENPNATVEAFAQLLDEAIAKKTGQPAAQSQEQTTPVEETVPTEQTTPSEQPAQ